MLKLKRLKIRRYLNVAPCDLRFSDKVNVLLGPNGAGKTTLLEFISKVLSGDIRKLSDFSIEVELAAPAGILAGVIESTSESTADLPPNLQRVLEARPGAPRANALPHVDLTWTTSDPVSVVRIRTSGDSLLVSRDGDPGEAKYPTSLIGSSMTGGFPWFTDLALQFDSHVPIDHVEYKHASRFDESLDTFRAITGKKGDPSILRPALRPVVAGIRLIDQAAPEAGLHGAVSEGGMVPPVMVDVAGRRFTNGATDVLLPYDELRFLSETVRLLDLRSAIAKLELSKKEEDQDGEMELLWFENFNVWFTRRDGSVFQADHLSYGQKRLLAFLYYLDCNPSFVIADELVNGFHHAWLEVCMKAIGDRQAFLTSQNPLLLDYLFFDNVEQVKESFILCRTEADGDRDRMIWRNMTDDEATMFYDAYKVGLQYVGEILRTRGLW